MPLHQCALTTVRRVQQASLIQLLARAPVRVCNALPELHQISRAQARQTSVCRVSLGLHRQRGQQHALRVLPGRFPLLAHRRAPHVLWDYFRQILAQAIAPCVLQDSLHQVLGCCSVRLVGLARIPTSRVPAHARSVLRDFFWMQLRQCTPTIVHRVLQASTILSPAKVPVHVCSVLPEPHQNSRAQIQQTFACRVLPDLPPLLVPQYAPRVPPGLFQLLTRRCAPHVHWDHFRQVLDRATVLRVLLVLSHRLPGHCSVRLVVSARIRTSRVSAHARNVRRAFFLMPLRQCAPTIACRVLRASLILSLVRAPVHVCSVLPELHPISRAQARQTSVCRVSPDSLPLLVPQHALHVLPDRFPLLAHRCAPHVLSDRFRQVLDRAIVQRVLQAFLRRVLGHCNVRHVDLARIRTSRVRARARNVWLDFFLTESHPRAQTIAWRVLPASTIQCPVRARAHACSVLPELHLDSWERRHSRRVSRVPLAALQHRVQPRVPCVLPDSLHPRWACRRVLRVLVAHTVL